MFVIVRKDLTDSQRAVQGGHALAEFLLHGPSTNWSNGTLIYLGVKGLKQLHTLKRKFDNEHISYSMFVEPDMNNEITALATDIENKHLKKLNLL